MITFVIADDRTVTLIQQAMNCGVILDSDQYPKRKTMPKGRGANTRRRSYRQLHPLKDKNTEGGYIKLLVLYQRARQVQRTRRALRSLGL